MEDVCLLSSFHYLDRNVSTLKTDVKVMSLYFDYESMVICLSLSAVINLNVVHMIHNMSY